MRWDSLNQQSSVERNPLFHRKKWMEKISRFLVYHLLQKSSEGLPDNWQQRVNLSVCFFSRFLIFVAYELPRIRSWIDLLYDVLLSNISACQPTSSSCFWKIFSKGFCLTETHFNGWNLQERFLLIQFLLKKPKVYGGTQSCPLILNVLFGGCIRITAGKNYHQGKEL